MGAEVAEDVLCARQWDVKVGIAFLHFLIGVGGWRIVCHRTAHDDGILRGTDGGDGVEHICSTDYINFINTNEGLKTDGSGDERYLCTAKHSHLRKGVSHLA